MSIKVNELLSGQNNEKDANNLLSKYKKNFDFNDYLYQINLAKGVGSAKNLLSMLPNSVNSKNVDLSKFENLDTHIKIINNMTEDEKKSPLLVKTSSSVKLKIAKKSGVEMVEINKLIKQFESIKEKYQNMPDMKNQKLTAEEILNNSKLREFFSPKIQKLKIKPKK
jgi:signal recognition particle GTPase